MNLTKITDTRRRQIERDNPNVKFNVINGTIKGMVLSLKNTVVHVIVESYSVTFSEPTKKEVFELRYFIEVPGNERLFVTKQFDTLEQRELFINEHLADMPTDELVLETVTVLDD